MPQFNYLEVAKLTLINTQTDECAHLMPALESGGSGVDVKKTERTVILNFEDVAVSTYEKLRRTLNELPHDAAVIAPRISSDMSHQYVCSFTSPAQTLGEHSAQVAAVTISNHGSKRSERSQPFCHLC